MNDQIECPAGDACASPFCEVHGRMNAEAPPEPAQQKDPGSVAAEPLVFTFPGGKEALRIEPNGAIYVLGTKEKTDASDPRVFESFKKWLAAAVSQVDHVRGDALEEARKEIDRLVAQNLELRQALDRTHEDRNTPPAPAPDVAPSPTG